MQIQFRTSRLMYIYHHLPAQLHFKYWRQDPPQFGILGFEGAAPIATMATICEVWVALVVFPGSNPTESVTAISWLRGTWWLPAVYAQGMHCSWSKQSKYVQWPAETLQKLGRKQQAKSSDIFCEYWVLQNTLSPPHATTCSWTSTGNWDLVDPCSIVKLWKRRLGVSYK
jgi:hypothetical protein